MGNVRRPKAKKHTWMASTIALPVKLGKFLCDYSVFSRSHILRLMRKGKVRVFVPNADFPAFSSSSPAASPASSSALRDVTLQDLNSSNSVELQALSDGTPIFEHDLVFLNEALVSRTPLPQYYFAFNKPENFITKRGEGHGGKATIEQFFSSLPAGVEPVGRLDRMTTGLMLLTNDGDLSHAVFKNGAVTKEYHLLLWGGNLLLTDPRLQQLLQGIELTDGPARASEIRILDTILALGYCPQQFKKHNTEGLSKGQQKKLAKMQRNKRTLSEEKDDIYELLSHEEIREKWSLVALTIAEGRNRIVRRMAKHVGLLLVHLHRARFGSLSLTVPSEKKLKTESSEPSIHIESSVMLQPGTHCALSAAQRQALIASSELAGDNTLRALQSWLLRAQYFRKEGRPIERLEQFFRQHGIDMSVEIGEALDKVDEEEDNDQDD